MKAVRRHSRGQVAISVAVVLLCFLAKPFSRDELTTVVARVLAEPASP